MLKTKNHFVLLLFFIWSGCVDEAIKLPKARMFPKVVYPEKNMTAFDTSLCNFTFRLPDYCNIVRDSFIFDGKPSHPCWFDIQISALNASIHCSYYTTVSYTHLDVYKRQDHCLRRISLI